MFAEKIARTLALYTICTQVVITIAIVALAPMAPSAAASAMPETATVSWEPSDLGQEEAEVIEA